VSDGFFQTLGHLVFEALDHEAPLSLPTADNAMVAAAMEYTKAHLSSVTVADVCRAVAASERTLRRQFDAAVGMSWRTYLLHARMLRAMALLVSPGDSVQKTASAVGFESLSAFTRAFTRFCGETPSSYRQRTGASDVT
jgi:AraC-like DNA-binding protein